MKKTDKKRFVDLKRSICRKTREKTEEKTVLLTSDLCVACGTPVPEGRMVCYACESEIAPYKLEFI